jgi:hypothetical protein
VDAAQFVNIKTETMQQIRRAMLTDETMKQLKEVIHNGWPENKKAVHPLVGPYFHIRDELLVQDDLVYKGEQVVIPHELRKQMLEKIHYAHLGINGCIRRAKECLFWPGMTVAIHNHVEQCEACQLFDNKQKKETLMAHEVPNKPWSKVGSDLFQMRSALFGSCRLLQLIH